MSAPDRAAQRVVRNTTTTALAQIATMAASFVLAPWLIHSFGPQAYGAYMLVAAVAAFTSLLDLGLGPALEKLLAEDRAAGRLDEAGALVASVSRTYGLLGVGVAAIDAALAWATPRVFAIGPTEVPLVRSLLLVAAAAALVWWPLSVSARVLGGLQRHSRVAGATALMAVLQTVGTIVLLALGRGPVALAVLTQVVLVSGAGVLGVAARHELAAAGVPSRPASSASLRRAFAFSGPVFVLNLAAQVLYHHTDRLLLGMFVGSVAVALYEGPARFVAVLLQLIGFGNAALLPRASELHAAGDHAGLQRLLLTTSRLVSAFAAPLALLFAVLARPLLVGWLGPAFAAAEAPAVLLCGLQVFLVALTVGHTVVVATGRLAGRLPVILGIVTLNVVLSVALVRTHGMTGVALATVVAALVDLPLHLRYLVRHVGLDLGAFVREVVLPVYPLLALPAALAWGARVLGFTDTLLSTLVVFAGAAMMYWLVFAGLVVRRDERAAWLATVRGALRPGGPR